MCVRRRRDEGAGDRRRAAQRPRVAAQHLPEDDSAAEAAEAGAAGAAGAASRVSSGVRTVTVSTSSPVSIAQVCANTVMTVSFTLVYFTLLLPQFYPVIAYYRTKQTIFNHIIVIQDHSVNYDVFNFDRTSTLFTLHY